MSRDLVYTREGASCGRIMGMDVTYRVVPDATHGTVAYLGLPDLVAFLDKVGA